MDKICVGDVVTITRGSRYEPIGGDAIGIIIDRIPKDHGFIEHFIVMWNGQVDGLPARRLKKIVKSNTNLSMPVQKEDATR
tara:strand:- start:43 stop:285 length:243 start_codon:yes stop_codon:yes gene_type:complete